jgi:plastocyanin
MQSLSPAAAARILVPVAVCLLLLAAACSSDDSDGNGNVNGETAAPTAAPTDAPSEGLGEQPDSPQAVSDEVTEAADGSIATTMEDNLFSANNLKVPLGQATTIEIANDGAAIHNMRIAGPDGEWNTDDDSVSDPEFVAGGDTAVLEFTPPVPGTYTFRCDFHPLEQGGVIVVE